MVRDVKVLHTDDGTEYFNFTLSKFLTKNGIIHQSSCVNSPQLNGIFEQKNRHMVEVAGALLFQSNVSKYFWGMPFLQLVI